MQTQHDSQLFSYLYADSCSLAVALREQLREDDLASDERSERPPRQAAADERE